jgi:hypothetical protein
MQGAKTLTLGPNSGLDVPQGGDFKIVEVLGSSLQQHHNHLVHIESLIDRQTLSFLFSGGEKTATQSILESAQMQATLSSLGECKASVMENLFKLWGTFSGDTVAADAGVDLSSTVFEAPVTKETLALAKELYNNDLLSRASVLMLESKLGLLPEGRTINQEEEAIRAQRPAPARTPGPNDLAELPLFRQERTPAAAPVAA